MNCHRRWAIGPCGALRRRAATISACPPLKYLPVMGNSLFVAQFPLDEIVRHVSPAHALQDQLLLHELIAHGPAARALDQEIVVRRSAARGVADHALHVVAHPFRRDRAGDRKLQEAGRHHRHQPHAEQIDEFEARVALVDVMQDEIRLVVEQAFPGSGQRLEMEMEPRARAAVEEAAQQRQRLRQRAEIADHDAELALLAHRELRRVRLERLQFMQQHPRAFVERSPGLGQADAIAAAIEQAQAQLAFEVLHRERDRGLGTPHPGSGRLEAALAHHRVEAEQLVDRNVHHRTTL